MRDQGVLVANDLFAPPSDARTSDAQAFTDEGIDPDSAVIPVRKGAVMWLHYGAQWNDEAIGAEALQWVETLWVSRGDASVPG